MMARYQDTCILILFFAECSCDFILSLLTENIGLYIQDMAEYSVYMYGKDKNYPIAKLDF